MSVPRDKNKTNTHQGFFKSPNHQETFELKDDESDGFNSNIKGGDPNDLGRHFEQEYHNDYNSQSETKDQYNSSLKLPQKISNNQSEINSLINSPMNADRVMDINFNSSQKTTSNNNEETDNRDNISLIDSVGSTVFEQGLSVDGHADMNDFENIVATKYKQLTEEYLKCAAICHECLVNTDEDGNRSFQSSSPDEIAICQRLKEIGVEFQGIRKEKGYVKLFKEDRIFEMLMVILVSLWIYSNRELGFRI